MMMEVIKENLKKNTLTNVPEYIYHNVKIITINILDDIKVTGKAVMNVDTKNIEEVKTELEFEPKKYDTLFTYLEDQNLKKEYFDNPFRKNKRGCIPLWNS